MFTPWACKRNRRLQNTIAATISLGLGTMKDYWLELLLLFFAFFFITIILCKRFLCIRKRRQKCLLAKIFFTLSLYTHTYIYIYRYSIPNVRLSRLAERSHFTKPFALHIWKTRFECIGYTIYYIYIYIFPKHRWDKKRIK